MGVGRAHRIAGAATRIEPSLTFLRPRKLPRQARAHATVDAIVDACARLLANGPYEALTTNSISERAGVSIGTLYEYFPNRESIVAALTAASCHRLVAALRRGASETRGMGDFEGVEHLLRSGVTVLSAPENVFRRLMLEAPFVLRLPAFHEARATLDEICEGIRAAAGERVNLPEPQLDAWLISEMLFSAMLRIAIGRTDAAQRDVMIRELARMTFRMATARDPRPDEMPPREPQALALT
ncbi:MAG TPA: TetR/AcrR family transcriptional regulator [Phenylobacterium sp.]